MLDKVSFVEYTLAMSFGKNPHPAKAEAEEQKAHNASDARAREQAWREAARQWDRAAEKEKDAGRKATYLEKAESARANADEPSGSGDGSTRADSSLN
jgi:hypothetical protein